MKKFILPSFIGVSIALIMFLSSSIKELQDDIRILQEIQNKKENIYINVLDSLLQRIDSLEHDLDAQRKTLEEIKRSRLKTAKLLTTQLKIVRLEHPLMSAQAHVKFHLDDKFREALFSYDGPPILITSAFRTKSFGNKKSKHKQKKAVDIAWDTKVADWLLSEKGKQWIVTNNLTVYFEKIKDKKYKNTPFFLKNPRATGPHIHIQIS